MSIGICGFCKKFIEDDEYVIYEYFSCKLSEIKLADNEKFFDGFITIKKNYLIEPELKDYSVKKRKKTKDKLFGLNKIKVLNIIHAVYEHINNKDIEIENCSNASKILVNGIDFVCYSLCLEIFIDYQKEGTLPEKCSVFF